MALKGTLKDFGIAEILQLIGQQAKSGVLHLESRDDVIHIAMADGNVVRAESAGRKAREKLGSRLVRAGIIGEPQLEQALEIQRRTLRRLGDVLVELGAVSTADLREMTALQTTETVYKLFHWKSGTYAFEPGDVDWDPETVTPLRAESVLMEGFRQVDEWPLVRKRISSPALTFERMATPPAGAAPAGTDELDGLLGGSRQDGGAAGASALGPSERRAYDLAVPGRTVEQIVDRSRLGEFETCKALLNLVNQGFLRPVAPARARSGGGGYAAGWRSRLRAGLARAGATVAIAVALAGIAYWVDEGGMAFGEAPAGARLRDDGARRFLARYELARLRGALEVYRLERGAYPDHLEALVDDGLASPRDLRYPWREPYHYRRGTPDGYVLLPPIE